MSRLPLPVGDHPAARALARELEGEVRFDRLTRALYATDASIYQILPIGVVFPRHDEDVRRIVDITAAHRLPILPRGGGTSLAGQTVGEAVVIDFSKHMNHVVEVDAEQGWARVQPGVVLDTFNTLLRPSGWMFGPDVSPSAQATLGGMIGNNSCGARSVRYGKMIDHVLELGGFLPGGTPFRFGALTADEVARALEDADPISRVIKTVNALVVTHREEIDRRFPTIMRRVSGYNLDTLGLTDGFNLAGLLVGSEGTLAVHVEARVRLVRRPAHAVLGICHFAGFADSMRASAPIVGLDPHAVELSDRLLLDLARESPLYRDKLHFVRGSPEAILIVEFCGEDHATLLRKLGDLETLMRDLGHGACVTRVLDAERQADVWAVRKAGLGLYGGMKGDAKPVAFVEDTAVAPDKLPAFTAEFREILDRHGVRAAFYGHASVGCLHVRPILDLRRRNDIQNMRAVAEEITDLALRFGGAHSAEHGEGLARSEFNPRVFGETLYAAFKEVKAAFDPDGRMNPGKKVDAPPMHENLRYGPDYQVSLPPPLLDYSNEGGVDKAIEMCNGNARCRKAEAGTMCPSYMVTLDERYSTRGRANALRMIMSGDLPPETLVSDEMYDVMDLCISCKGCKAECPSRVDMAKHKLEFLARYYRERGVPLRARLFGHLSAIAAVGSVLAPVSTLLAGARPVRRILAWMLGLHADRPLPVFRRNTFRRWWTRHRPLAGADGRNSVVLFVDTFSNHIEPSVPIAAVRVLEAAGYPVIVPPPACCGRPLISTGLLESAVERARRTRGVLLPYAEAGCSIVGLEPSCILTFRDEYRYLLNERDTANLADRAVLIEEFLASEAQQAPARLAALTQRLRPRDAPVLLHGHCHQKALASTEPARRVLSWIPGVAVREIDSGCCGMAGSFGYEVEHYGYSMAMAERALLPAVRAATPGTIVVANGASCRQQIRDGTGREALHVIEVLARSLAEVVDSQPAVLPAPAASVRLRQ